MSIFHNPVRSSIAIISIILIIAIWSYTFIQNNTITDIDNCKQIVYDEITKNSADIIIGATSVWQRQQKKLLWISIWKDETCNPTVTVEYNGKEYTIPVSWYITGENNKILQLIAVESSQIDPSSKLAYAWSGKTFWKEVNSEENKVQTGIIDKE